MTEPATRTERDTLGEIEVPAERYWGAQTQRALHNFPIGDEPMPAPVIHALGLIKSAAAAVHAETGELPAELADAIRRAADEVAAGERDAEFPLRIWQSGSGTQTNMNANEVVASRANELLTGRRGGKEPVHPNDHVNRGQSSNDVFPTAMHVAAARQVTGALIPSLRTLHRALQNKADAFASVVKIGRTHLQDAVPMTVGDELSGQARQVELAIARAEQALPRLCELALGGTAVGTGLGTRADFGDRCAKLLADRTGLPFAPAANRFEAIAGHDAIVEASGAMATIAASLHRLANDVRLLASGPRCGLAELVLPANEPGSSIMPGKVNPTQAEVLAMVCARVAGNHATVVFAGAQGHLQLQVYKPVLIDALLQSIALLGDGALSFAERCVAGLDVDRARVARHVERSLMRVTALAPHVGYDTAAKIAQLALRRDTTLREAALELGAATAEQLDEWLAIDDMLGPRR